MHNSLRRIRRRHGRSHAARPRRSARSPRSPEPPRRHRRRRSTPGVPGRSWGAALHTRPSSIRVRSSPRRTRAICPHAVRRYPCRWRCRVRWKTCTVQVGMEQVARGTALSRSRSRSRADEVREQCARSKCAKAQTLLTWYCRAAVLTNRRYGCCRTI